MKQTTERNKMKKPVLVTTEHRGVFFGYVKDDKKSPNEITLTDARMCIYWSSNVKGFMGLASYGPTDSCRIGRQVKEIKLYKITSITPVDKEAVEKWKNA